MLPSMRTACLMIAAGLLVGSACRQAAPTLPAEPALLNTATIRDIMDSMVDPSADYLFEAVSTVADEHGITEKAPKTAEEWQEVRRRAIQLLEAPNLLTTPGRSVARPEDAAKNPEVELQPAQIQALIEADRPTFIGLARGLQDAATLAVKASEARDKDALFRASESIDKACETCHLRYWYPNDKRAQEVFRQNQSQK